MVAAAAPPPSLRSALADKGCTSVRWSALAHGEFLADCVVTRGSRLDGVERSHRDYLLKRRPDGGFTIQKLFEYGESSSIRAKGIPVTKVKLAGSRLRVEQRDSFGWIHLRVWDLSGPTLVEEQEGGRQICMEGISRHSSKLVEPRCTMNLAHTVCEWEHPDCRGDDSERPQRERYVAIPVHLEGAEQRVAALAECAVEIGDQATDRVGDGAGGAKVEKGAAGVTFRVVAVDDAKGRRLRVVLRARDATPATGNDGDRFELYLASGRMEPNCGDAGDWDAWCAAKKKALQLRRFTVWSAADGAPMIAAAGGASGPDSEARAVLDGGDRVIELSGALYDAAHDGGITVAYHDVRGGGAADQVIASSTIDPARPESAGRLGDAARCDRVTPRDPEAVPTEVAAGGARR